MVSLIIWSLFFFFLALGLLVVTASMSSSKHRQKEEGDLFAIIPEFLGAEPDDPILDLEVWGPGIDGSIE